MYKSKGVDLHKWLKDVDDENGDYLLENCMKGKKTSQTRLQVWGLNEVFLLCQSYYMQIIFLQLLCYRV